MKRSIMAAASLLFVGSLAMAAETKNEQTRETDVTKNPITGTVTETETTKSDVETPAGTEDVTIKNKKKTYKDGTVSRETEVDADLKKKMKTN